jgi:hypothetical protein
MRLCLSLCCLLLLSLTSCIKPHPYEDVMPQLATTGSGMVAIGTQDQRPYVVSGSTKPSFVGLVRSPFGIPYASSTASGRPLAEEVTSILVRAFQQRGFQAMPVVLSPTLTDWEVGQRFAALAPAAAVLVIIREWKSDTHTDTALAYDLTLKVHPHAGERWAETQTQGKDVLGPGSLGNAFGGGQGQAAATVPVALQRKLEMLLNNPMILTTLQSTP